MAKLVIVGGKKLVGTVKISGSKNASLPCLIATLLTDEPCIVRNVPQLGDIDTTCTLLSCLGKRVKRKDDVLYINKRSPLGTFAPYEVVSKMRASFLVAGPLLARCKEAEVSLPGGCAIGSRPIDMHLQAFKELGASIKLRGGYVHLKTTKLKGTKIFFKTNSVGATENLLMACVLAKGKTIIENAALEPEVTDLANMLIKLGADIKGIGTRTLEVDGVENMNGGEYSVIPDRIEAGTFLVASAITKGDLVLDSIEPLHLEAIINLLRKSGMDIKVENNTVHVKWNKELIPVDCDTMPYPGLPTDLQALWVTLMATVTGKTVVRENIFENRFLYIDELRRMGAKIECQGNTAIIEGVKKLSGAPVSPTDLRASAALVLAGLSAEGKTEVSPIYHLQRGYEDIEKKLRRLGANIKKVT